MYVNNNCEGAAQSLQHRPSCDANFLRHFTLFYFHRVHMPTGHPRWLLKSKLHPGLLCSATWKLHMHIRHGDKKTQIMLALCSMLWNAHYAKNYAGIIIFSPLIGAGQRTRKQFQVTWEREIHSINRVHAVLCVSHHLLVATLNFNNGKMCCVNITMCYELDKKMQMLQLRGIVIAHSHNEIIRKSSHMWAGAC